MILGQSVYPDIALHISNYYINIVLIFIKEYDIVYFVSVLPPYMLLLTLLIKNFLQTALRDVLFIGCVGIFVCIFYILYTLCLYDCYIVIKIKNKIFKFVCLIFLLSVNIE